MSRRTETLVLRPRDGLTVKDARGFNVAGGVPASALSWPLPPTVIGAARTSIGVQLKIGTDSSEPTRRKWEELREQVCLEALLPVFRHASSSDDAEWTALWPSPRDAMFFPSANSSSPDVVRLSPAPTLPQHRGCWEDDELLCKATDGLWLATLDERRKPLRGPSWWAHEDMIDWLLGSGKRTAGKQAPAPVRRLDVHVKIDANSLTAQDSMLFSHETYEYLKRESPAEGVWESISHVELALAVALGIDERIPAPSDNVWRLGGEGRTARVESARLDATLKAPPSIANLVGQRRFRLLVVTPAYFRSGWYPDWLEPRRVEGTDTVELRGEMPSIRREVVLRSALSDRPMVLSGWDFVKREPKPSRKVVCPGTVYFFELVGNDGLSKEDAHSLWAQSIQRPGQDRDDGFGRSLPGIWPESMQTENILEGFQ